MFEKVT